MSEGSASPPMNNGHAAPNDIAQAAPGAPPEQQGADGPPNGEELQEMLGTTESIFPLPPKSLYAPFAEYSEETKDKSEFQPPRVDWIVEDGSWQVFGETWPIEESLPTLEDMGINPMYDPQADSRDSLQKLLRTSLKTYFELLNALTKPPPAHQALMAGHPDDLEKISEHLRLTSINMHHLVNQLRPVQAKENLVNILKEEIEDKRSRTQTLKEKSAQVTEALNNLQRYKPREGGPVEPPQQPKSQQQVKRERELESLMQAIDAI